MIHFQRSTQTRRRLLQTHIISILLKAISYQFLLSVRALCTIRSQAISTKLYNVLLYLALRKDNKNKYERRDRSGLRGGGWTILGKG